MEMSVARGLRKLKTLTERVGKVTDETHQQNLFALPIQNNTVAQGFKSNQDYVSNAQAKFQSIQDLIKERAKIKAAIVKSNANKVIDINGKKMTVAEAIEYKKSIALDKDLLKSLKSNYARTYAVVNQNNDRVEQAAHDSASKVSEDKASSEYQTIYDAVKEKRGWRLLSLPGIVETIEDMENNIFQFEEEVDVVLDESNSTTMITVE